MYSILHKITIETTPDQLYRAITEQEGLSAWWTKTNSDGKTGSTARFFFGPNGDHQIDMEIKQQIPRERVSWQCVAEPWEDTGLFTFDISPDERGSVLRFRHENWPKTDDFYQHCNTKWGFFLAVSLKDYLEKGVGHPHPHDPNI